MSSYIEAINQTTTAATGQESTKSRNEAVMGKEDFLSLLVAQLQNQDPLNPDEPTEFTAQLAQFSSLEQLFTLNESMQNLVASSADANRFSALSTIGKEVAYHSDNFNFSGEEVQFGYKLDTRASLVRLTLQHNGVTVKTFSAEDLTPGNHFFTWDGVTDEGYQAAPGNYTIGLQATTANGENLDIAPLIRSEVTGVNLQGGYGGILITRAGEISFNDILGVYETGSRTGSVSEHVAEEDSAGEEPPVSESAPENVASVTETIENSGEIIN